MKKDWTDDELVEMLCGNSDFALVAIFETYKDVLLNYFVFNYNHIDEADISSIITDSIIKLTDKPEKYDKAKSALKTYLIIDIEGDILNLIEKKKRKKNKLYFVELDENNGNINEDNKVEIEEQEIQIKKFFQTVFSNDLDCQLAWMIEIEKDRNTEKYVEHLQIKHLTSAEQREEVKRNKDRITAKLKRKGWKDFLKTLQ